MEITQTPWKMGERQFNSRLLVGTGKYRDFDQTREAIIASGAEIVTVALRRTNIGQDAGQPNLLGSDPTASTSLSYSMVSPPESFSCLFS